MTFTRCKKDANQDSIADAIKRIGGSVLIVSHLGLGFDLLVGYRGKNYLIEIKRPGKRGDLTENERALLSRWRGKYIVVETFTEFMEEMEK